MTLLSRLLLLIGIALLPALGVQVYGEFMAGQERERLVHEEALRLARSVALEQERVLEGARQLLTALGKAPPLMAGDPVACATYMDDVLREFPRYATVSAANLEGRIVCTARSNGPGQDVSDRAWFREALREDGFVTGNYIVGRGSGRPSISFSQPYRDPDGAPLGVLVAALDLAWLARQLDEAPMPEGAVTAIVDRNGVLLARKPGREGAVGRPMPSNFRPYLDAAHPSTAVEIGREGERRVLGYVPLSEKPRGLFVAVGLDASMAFADARRANRLGLLMVAAGCAFALLVTWFGARRLIWRPTATLLTVTDRWRAGDLSARVGSRNAGGRTEFGRLGAAFDGVAATLQAREAALVESEARFRSMADNAPTMVWATDAEGRCTYLSRPWCEFTGQTEAEGLGSGWLDAIHPDDRGRAEEAFLAGVRAGRPYKVECRLRRAADGGWAWVIDAAAPRFGPDGAYLGYIGSAVDISDRREAEERLRRSEERFRAAVLAVSGVVWTNDAAGRMVGEQPGWAALTGQSPDEYQGYGWSKAVHPDDAQPTVDAWNEAVAERKPFVFEHRVRQHDGAWRRFAVRAVPVLDAAGEVREWVGVHTDVTEQRDAEARLAESEARMRTILDTVPVGIVLAELPSGCILSGNRYLETLLRHPVLPSADVDSYDEWVSFHADGTRVNGREYPLARIVLAGEEHPSIDVHYQRGDGTRAWTRISGRPVRNERGELVGGVVALTDIDGERRAREALAERETHLRLALEAGRMGVWDWDIGTGQLAWGGRQFELFGRDPAHGQPHVDEVRDCIHPEDRPGLDAATLAALESEHGTYSNEFRIVLPDGSVRWLGAHGQTVRDSDGRNLRMVGLNFDITDRRRAEEVLARHKDELERLVEERTAALRESEQRLAQAAKMEALGRLAGGVAHDFNNVLQSVQGGIALARKRLNRSIDDAERFLDLATDAAARGASVTGRLLSFARRGELQVAPVEPAPMLLSLAEMLRPTLGPSVELRVQAADDIPALLADRGQLEAMLVNLANNARDALPGGTGVITLSASRGSPTPRQLPPGDYVRISVTDDGEGMTSEVLARVTEPFFTTKPKGKGTGLGLAMARGFAEQSGGALVIESERGCGTTVSVWLPEAPERAHVEPGVVPGGQPASLPALAQASLLVVDDEPDVRLLLATALAERGHIVEEADGGAAALARIDAGVAISALVTDLAMPGGMDGLALIREARKRRPGLPAVLITGHVGDAAHGALEEAAGSGPFALMRKPVASEVVEAQIAVLLEGERGRRRYG